jgi:hypothetical protein
LGGSIARAPDGFELPAGRKFRERWRIIFVTRFCSLASRWSRIWSNSRSIPVQRSELPASATSLKSTADRGNDRARRGPARVIDRCSLFLVQPSRELARRLVVPLQGGDDDPPLRQTLIAGESLEQLVDTRRDPQRQPTVVSRPLAWPKARRGPAALSLLWRHYRLIVPQ